MSESSKMPVKSLPLAVVDRAGPDAWGVYFDDGDGDHYSAAAKVPPLGDEAELRSYSTLLAKACGPLSALVIIDRTTYDESELRFWLCGSVPVYVIPASLVAAEAAGSSVERFVHLDVADAVSATLLMRAAAGVVRSAEVARFQLAASIEPLERFLAFARSLGYERIIRTGTAEVPGDTFDVWSGVDSDERCSIVSNLELHAAARSLVRRKSGGPGVFVYNDGAAALRMTVARTYSFVVEHTALPIFDLENDMLERALGARECVIFVDGSVAALYGARLEQYARERLRCLRIVSVDASEHSKTLDRAQDACAAAMASGIRRDGIFVACGGGVLLDMIGTAASIYRRGTDYFRIPTTLVGMIDVCVGIKQGVNFRGYKNFLGAFHAPVGGLNDLRFLATVPRPAISAGLAEIIKVAMLLDPTLFELLENVGAELLDGQFQRSDGAAQEVVFRAELAMMRELQPNLWERDLRRYVDFGHTFSSLIETESNFEITHGHAVALDMLVSTAIAVELHLCSSEVLRRLKSLFIATELPLEHELCSMNLLHALAPMRVHRAGNLNLVVPIEIGRGTFLQDVEPKTLRGALERIERAEMVAPV